VFGPTAVRRWLNALSSPPGSEAFADGGFYVMRNSRDHVFVDCGPLGLAGRGGHGHNDLTSFEAVLDGIHLVSDCGAYVYTASMTERNNFRSTAYHNVAMIDGEEINRFQRPDYLWTLHNDARHIVGEITFNHAGDRICVGHTGYERLNDPVTVWRTFQLDHGTHTLKVSDVFEGNGEHLVEVALHMAPGVGAWCDSDFVILKSDERKFRVSWPLLGDWYVSIEDARVSPTYGVVVATKRIVWRRSGSLRPLDITIAPYDKLAAL